MEDKFNFVKKGYDPNEVNGYIDKLEAVISSYKEKDNAIKNAIINAQIAAENIAKNAEIEANRLVSSAVSALEDITRSIDVQKRTVKEFQDEYNMFISKYVHTFNEADIRELYTKIGKLEDIVEKAKISSGECIKNPASEA